MLDILIKYILTKEKEGSDLCHSSNELNKQWDDIGLVVHLLSYVHFRAKGLATRRNTNKD